MTRLRLTDEGVFHLITLCNKIFIEIFILLLIYKYLTTSKS